MNEEKEEERKTKREHERTMAHRQTYTENT